MGNENTKCFMSRLLAVDNCTPGSLSWISAKHTIKRIGLLIALSPIVQSCTIHQNINITIMNKKTNHKTKYTYATSNTFKTHGGEKNSGKSITVQDEAYTIKELLEKHTQGLMPNVGKTPIYDYEEATHEDDITLRKPNLDLTDIDELKVKVKKTVSKVEQQKARKKKETENNDRSSAGKSAAEKDAT